MRIQPCLSPLPSLPPSCLAPVSDPTSTKALFFLVLLRDPTHSLVHASTSQSMPASWLDIPFEENEWVEDAMVEIIRRSVEIIGQEYITHRCVWSSSSSLGRSRGWVLTMLARRMRAQGNAIQQARHEAQQALAQQSQQQQQGPPTAQQHETEVEASQAAQEARVGVV